MLEHLEFKGLLDKLGHKVSRVLLVHKELPAHRVLWGPLVPLVQRGVKVLAVKLVSRVP